MLLIRWFSDLGSPPSDYFGVGPCEEGTTKEHEGTGRFTERKRRPLTTEKGNSMVAHQAAFVWQRGKVGVGEAGGKMQYQGMVERW